MTRGRDPSVSRTRVLVELLLHPDRAIYTGEVAEQLLVGTERTRQLLGDLEADGLIAITDVRGRNVHRLTDDGLDNLRSELREEID